MPIAFDAITADFSSAVNDLFVKSILLEVLPNRPPERSTSFPRLLRAACVRAMAPVSDLTLSLITTFSLAIGTPRYSEKQLFLVFRSLFCAILLNNFSTSKAY
jgi:hypothetical protein